MSGHSNWLAPLSIVAAAFLSPAVAAPTVYFGEDQGAGSIANMPNSFAARDQFVAALAGKVSGIETFESLPAGTEFFGNPSAKLDFVGSGVTATLTGGLVRNVPFNARFAVSGSNYLDTSFNQRIVFSQPVSAFGLFIVDANEVNNNPATATVNGQVLTQQQIDARPFDSIDGIFRIVALRESGQFEVLFTGGTFPSRDSSAMFVGLVDAQHPYTDIRLINGTSGLDEVFRDGFGYDQIYAARPVPEPATGLLMAAGLLGSASWRRLRRS